MKSEFYLDQDADDRWIIRREKERYPAGFDKNIALGIIDGLNSIESPSIEQVRATILGLVIGGY